MKSLNNKQIVFVIFLIGLIVRLIALPFSQIIDADGVTRVFIGMRWLENPIVFTYGVWLPIHHYFNALTIGLTNNHTIAPMLMHILFAALTAFPLYAFTKREFSEKGAWFATLLYLLSPVVFKNSFQPLSGIPYGFFIANTFNFLSLYIRTNKIKYAIFAGLAITMASGFRYEAWVLIALFTGMLLYLRLWKGMIYFWVFAMIFPAFWMIGNYIEYGDIFRGLTGAYNWNILKEGVNDNITIVNRWQRIVFFPYSWFLIFSPFVVIPLLILFIKKLKNNQIITMHVLWAIPFIVMMVTFVYKSYVGTLLDQHRFTTSLILLSAPFAALLFENPSWSTAKKVWGVVVILSLIPLSYIWLELPVEKLFKFHKPLYTAFKNIRINTHHQFKAIPQVKDLDYVTASELIQENTGDSSGLILDFISWENTYNLALESGLHPNQIFMVDGSKHGVVYKPQLKNIIEKYSNGVIVLKCNSKMMSAYENYGDYLMFGFKQTDICLTISPLWSKDRISIFKYERMASCPNTRIYGTGTVVFDCVQLEGIEYYKQQILNDPVWLDSVKRKAIEKGIPLEEMIDLDARWMVKENKKKSN
jgi:hypothetical protein